MGCNPCGGGSLQTGTKIVAIAHLTFGILILTGAIFSFGFGFMLAQRVEHSLTLQIENDSKHSYPDTPETTYSTPKQKNALFLGSLVVFTSGVMIMLLSSLSAILSMSWIKLASVLLEGAKKRHIGRCYMWLTVQLGLMIVLNVKLVMDGFNLGIVAYLCMLLELYFMLIVSAFIAELYKEKIQQFSVEGDVDVEKQTKLKEDEIKDGLGLGRFIKSF